MCRGPHGPVGVVAGWSGCDDMLIVSLVLRPTGLRFWGSGVDGVDGVDGGLDACLPVAAVGTVRGDDAPDRSCGDAELLFVSRVSVSGEGGCCSATACSTSVTASMARGRRGSWEPMVCGV